MSGNVRICPLPWRSRPLAPCTARHGNFGRNRIAQAGRVLICPNLSAPVEISFPCALHRSSCIFGRNRIAQAGRVLICPNLSAPGGDFVHLRPALLDLASLAETKSRSSWPEPAGFGRLSNSGRFHSQFSLRCSRRNSAHDFFFELPFLQRCRSAVNSRRPLCESTAFALSFDADTDQKFHEISEIVCGPLVVTFRCCPFPFRFRSFRGESYRRGMARVKQPVNYVFKIAKIVAHRARSARFVAAACLSFADALYSPQSSFGRQRRVRHAGIAAHQSPASNGRRADDAASVGRQDPDIGHSPR